MEIFSWYLVLGVIVAVVTWKLIGSIYESKDKFDEDKINFEMDDSMQRIACILIGILWPAFIAYAAVLYFTEDLD